MFCKAHNNVIKNQKIKQPFVWPIKKIQKLGFYIKKAEKSATGSKASWG